MFGHSTMMYRHGCYIDTGDTVNGAKGTVADPSGTSTDIDNDPEGEPDPDNGDADDPDQQKRTSKQDPKVDAAFAEARRAKEESDRLRAQLADYQELEKEYAEYNLRGPKAIAEAVRAEKQRMSQANANEAAQFAAWIKGEVTRLRAAGYDELQIEAYVDGKEAKYEAYQLRRETAQEHEQRKREKELEKQARAQEKQEKATEMAVNAVMGEYRDLRKEYPDLLPANCRTFESLMEQIDPKVRDKMMQGLTLEDAFKIVNLRKIAKREAEKSDEKDRDNADRATASGRDKGSADGGTYGLTAGQQTLAKKGGMTNKEYATLLKDIT